MPLSEWTWAGPVLAFEVLEEREDSRGEEWGTSWEPTGGTFRAVALRQSSRELFEEGRTDATDPWKLFADLPLPATRQNQVRSPETGRLELVDAREVKVHRVAVLKGEGGLSWQ